jgi:hypothetical protein
MAISRFKTSTLAQGLPKFQDLWDGVSVLLPTPPVATPSLWLDANLASSFTYSSSNVISSWADQSGNGRNATQATVANQPTLVANVMNSKPVVRIDGTNDSLAWTEYQPGGDRSVFMVFRNASNITSSGSFALLSSSGSQFPMYVVGLGNQTGGISGEVMAWLGVSSGGAQIRGRFNGSTITAGNHQLNFTQDSSYNLAVRFDKATYSTQAAPAGDFGSTTYPGFINQITGADGITLDVAEVLVYNRVLTGGEISTIESYFATKWGV